MLSSPRICKQNKRGLLLMTLCAGSTLTWCGCRSVPGMSMFAKKSEPSAEVLAGTGPTTTYPTPPSFSATPQAIASVAGGTAAPANASDASGTAKIAGIDISPGVVSPTTNFAAAQANGFARTGASTTTSPASKPSPYAFGSKTFTPKTGPETGSAMPTFPTSGTPASTASYGSSAYAKNSGSGSGSSAFSIPSSTSTSLPPAVSTSLSDSVASSGLTMPDSKSGGSSSGFSLPGESSSSIANSASQSMASSPAATPPLAVSPGSSGYSMPTAAPSADSATAPASYSTASVAGTNLPSSSTSVKPAGGYAPGSTGATSGYPGSEEAGSDGTPPTTGNFFR